MISSPTSTQFFHYYPGSVYSLKDSWINYLVWTDIVFAPLRPLIYPNHYKAQPYHTLSYVITLHCTYLYSSRISIVRKLQNHDHIEMETSVAMLPINYLVVKRIQQSDKVLNHCTISTCRPFLMQSLYKSMALDVSTNTDQICVLWMRSKNWKLMCVIWLSASYQ